MLTSAENYSRCRIRTGCLIFANRLPSQLKDDTRVAGVVSEKPGYLMNKGLEGENVVALALQGRVPVKVVGIVKKGDLLVAASTKGYAITNNQAGVGTVIGKAISTKDDAGKGVVEAVVGRV